MCLRCDRGANQSLKNVQAIAALNKALLASPGNPEVLLSLGVSYTNELDQRRAITYLMQWLSQQPGQAGAASVQLPANARESLRVAVDIFRTAAQMVRLHIAIVQACSIFTPQFDSRRGVRFS